jgi:aminoglycoside/choline kinase family phosphotransferase
MEALLDENALFKLTAAFLKDWPAVSRADAILKGGSDRRYFRLHFNGGSKPSLILMTYTLARPDNPRFVPATLRLERLGVRVPHIMAHDTDNLCVWLEDLGADDLHGFRQESWEVRQPLYRSALTEAAKLHQVDAAKLSADDLEEMELCFDEKLYEWEQGYFLKHFVSGILGRDTTEAQYAPAHEALRELREHLATLPRGLVHRDFQSQNVIIRNGGAWLIDYQGVRPGLAEYDLASLLLDPYVDLSEAERDDLLQWYAQHTGRSFPEMRQTYFLCAAQRLMQALGAYGNLSRNLGKPQFEAHIPVAVSRLHQVCQQHPSLQPLTALFADS